MRTILLGVVVAIALPLTSFAATYFYVDKTGELETVEAANSTQALLISTADRDVHSGVAIDTGTLEEGQTVSATSNANNLFGTGGPAGILTFQYVDVTGHVQFVGASNATEAIALAVNIHPNSGVVLAETNPIDSDATVPVR